MAMLTLRTQATAAGPRPQQLEQRDGPVPALHGRRFLPLQRREAAGWPNWQVANLQHPRRLATPVAAVRAEGPSAAGMVTQRNGDEYFATDKRPIILFDGVCNLCNGGVNFMLQWDRDGRFRFAALQSAAGRALLERSGRSPDDISSIVLVEPSASYIKSQAILRIAAGLQLPLPLVAAALDVFPRPFKDAVYDQVANNRYLIFGRTQSCRLSDARFEERFVA